jgi:hypothetical protein
MPAIKPPKKRSPVNWVKDKAGRLPVPGFRMTRKLSANTADKAMKEGSFKEIRHNWEEKFVKEKCGTTIFGSKKKVTKTWASNRKRESYEKEITSNFKGKSLTKQQIDNANTGIGNIKYDDKEGIYYRKSIGPTGIEVPILGIEYGTKTVLEKWDSKGRKISRSVNIISGTLNKTISKQYRIN